MVSMMSTSARAEIFAKLRSVGAAGGAATAQRERIALGRAPSAALPAQEPYQAFLHNVIANRGTVDCAGNRSEAVKAVARYLYEHYRTQRLVAGNDPRLAALPWRDAGLLPRFGALGPADPVALSFAQLAVAETGAIITWTGKANPAANNLLPEHHIVLVNAIDLVKDMEYAWDRINAHFEQGTRPRGINFIAGPSTTADIAGHLVTGAHGPRRWHVILIGELPAEALAYCSREAERVTSS